MQSPYQDLRAGFFRLLTLHPGNEADDIEASITTHPQSESPPYDAISYTWGEPGNEGVVYIDGIRYRVRRNLWDFLNILRSPSQHVCLWVDALCIKQNNPVEKGQQVQMIGCIFRNARRVSIWLGESSPYTKVYFCAASAVRLDPRKGWRDILFQGTKQWNSRKRQERQMLNMAFMELFQRPYWTRAWIIQECILNQELVLHCGQYTATWIQFAAVSQETWDHSGAYENWTKDKERGWRNCRRIDECRYYRDLDEFDLNTLLKFQPRNCVDRRDTIYAFMELLEEAKPDNSARLIVDYTISMATLYIRVCHAHFSTSQLRYTEAVRDLKDDLKLTDGDLDCAIRAVIDPSELFLPLRYFKAPLEGVNNKPLSLHPNRQDPDREYNILELYAADFERLATGTLKDGGRRLPPPRWWEHLFPAASFEDFESGLVASLKNRRGLASYRPYDRGLSAEAIYAQSIAYTTFSSSY